jgi:LysM repeat protein
MKTPPSNPLNRPRQPVYQHPNAVVRRAQQPNPQSARPVPRPPRKPTPSKRTTAQDRPWLLPALTVGAALIVMLPGLLLTLLFISFEWGGLIYPGVTVGDVRVGWLSSEKAADKLDVAWNTDKTLQVSDGINTWTAKPQDFGIYLDTITTVDRAYAVGRGQGWITELVQIFFRWQWSVAPEIAFNPETAQTVLQAAAPVIGTPPREAQLSYADGNWQGAPGEAGIALDIEATLKGLAAGRELVLRTGYLKLVMAPVQPGISDISLVVDYLNQAYPSPPRFEIYDPLDDASMDLSLPTEVLATWIKTESSSDLTLYLEEEKINQYLQSWDEENLENGLALETNIQADELLDAWQKDNPFTIYMRHEPIEYTVQSGERMIAIGERFGIPYWKILEANPGISPDYVTAGQVLQIPSPNELLPLPVVRNKRILISLSQQRMRAYEDGSLLHEYTISSGIDSSPTHPGIFQIQTHEINAYASVWDLYMPHFLGIYEGWPGFMNGIHGLPTLSSGRLMWAGALGKPASYGCIVLGLDEAESLYEWAESGVIVEITP